MLWLRDHLSSRKSVSNVSQPTCVQQELRSIEEEEQLNLSEGEVDDVSDSDFENAQVVEVDLSGEDENVEEFMEEFLHFGAIPIAAETTASTASKSKASSTTQRTQTEKCERSSSSMAPPANPPKSLEKKKNPVDSLVNSVSEATAAYKNALTSRPSQSGLGQIVEDTYKSLSPSKAKRFKKAILRCIVDAEDD